MKKALFLTGIFFAALFFFSAEKARAMVLTKTDESPILSAEWSDPAKGGWFFGAATATMIFTVDDETKYKPINNSDPSMPAVKWTTEDDGSGPLADSVTKVSDNTYQAVWNLGADDDPDGVGGAIMINVYDTDTGDTINGYLADGSPMNVSDLSLFMAHNANVYNPGMNAPGTPCYSPDREDESTDFSQVEDLRSVDLTLMCPALGKIHFINPINAVSTETMSALRSIFDSLEMDQEGTFGMSDETVKALRSVGAEVTIYDLPYVSAPDIKYNGTAGGVASDIVFNADDHSVTFTANHFSSYTAIPKVTLTAPASDLSVSTSKYTITGTVSDPAATVHLYDGTVDLGAATVNFDGTFSREITLIAGENNIKVTSSNSIGSGVDVTRTITYTALPATGISVYLAVLLLIAFGLGGFILLKTRKQA